MEIKKISCRLDYLPARLARKADRWEIVFYQTNPETGIRKRHRETWELNRIPDKKERAAAAKRAIDKINSLLPYGYPYQPADTIERKLSGPTLADGISMAIDIKLKTDREESRKTIRSIGNIFQQWVTEKKMGQMPLEDFTRRMAIDFLDYIAERQNKKNGKKLSNRTWNNYKGVCSGFFYALIEREYITQNPFGKITKKVVMVKARRKCTPEERAVVAEWLWDNDYFTFLAVTLHYYGFFRGTEIRRLRAEDFNLQTGLIYLKAENSKTKRERWVTMPEQLQTVLCDVRFTEIPGNYIVFGKGGKPHPHEACSRNKIWYRLAKCLQVLKEAGKLDDTEGISPYSFKDTGITEFLKVIPLPEVMRQAGHTNPGTTMIYYQPDRVSQAFKNLKSDIFDASTSQAPPASRPDPEKK